MVGPKCPPENNFANRPPDELREISRRGGQSRSPKKIAAALQNNPLTRGRMTVEQRHFVGLLQNDMFATCIKDMLVYIATKAETADDYHKLLTQIMKLPFIQKVYQDIYKDQQQDIIPIIITVLRRHGQEAIIAELLQELRRSGWNGDNNPRPTQNHRDPTMPPLRPTTEQEEPQGRIVEGTVDQN